MEQHRLRLVSLQLYRIKKLKSKAVKKQNNPTILAHLLKNFVNLTHFKAF